MISRIINWLRSFWRKTPADQPTPQKPQQASRAEDVETAGRWYFRKNVLDRLDDYFLYLKALRDHDVETFALCSKIGAAIPADRLLLAKSPSADDLARANVAKLAFGAVAPFLGVPDEKKNVHIKFLCFRKLDRSPPNVQPTNGTVYAVTAVYMDKRQLSELGRPLAVDFHVSVDADGSLLPLKHLGPHRQTLPGPRRFSVVHLRWEFPELISGLAREHDTTPTDAAARLFWWAYSTFANANSDVRVSVKRGGMSAMIGVDLLRVPYFFRDREKVIGPDGKAKKIFHIVRTHIRADGSAVKSHFRGLRRFVWNGYNVNITMPGKHHADVLDASFGAHEFGPGEEIPNAEKMVGFSDAISRVAEGMNR